MDVSYNELMNTPEKVLKTVVDFINVDANPAELAQVVSPDLYRNRNEG
jgi:hypothetical protein